MNNQEIGIIVEKALRQKESLMIYKHIDSVKIIPPDFSEDKKFRYKLEINLKNKDIGETICIIMQNPSYANEDIADKSVNFLEKLIFEKNYSEFNNINKIIIINQFAYIQTNDFKGTNEQIGERNNKIIEETIRNSDLILIAWGVSNSYKERKEFINSILINQTNKDKKQLATKKHPSRGFYENFIDTYHANI